MKVLLLSFYFTPDLSAGSFRNTAFVESLQKLLPEGSEIHVVTTLPNRYSAYNAKAQEEESSAGLSITRVPLPAHKSGMVDQSQSFLAYAKRVRAIVAEKEYDIVFASSSRLMTAALGAWVARRLNVPLYLDIRDIFVDTINDILPRKLVWLMRPLFGAVERWTISRADRLNVVSEGFLPYFETRYPRISKVVYTNGIDEVFASAAPEKSFDTSSFGYTDKSPDRLIEVVYAGNMGEGQGLHSIIPVLAKRLEGRVIFRLIGGGGRLLQLERALDEAHCCNVVLSAPVAREELIKIYQNADVLFLHLNDYDAFRKVLPSKIFEYGALGKPIWAGVSGYAASFVNEHLDNAAVFSPCDVSEAIKAFETLRVADEPRANFVKQFSRKAIMDEMSEDLCGLMGTAS